jgi:nucleotide-binding universal stress UspA family protein
MTTFDERNRTMDEIVVGMDGSPGAAAALRWAVRAGELRSRPVTAVMAWGLLDQHHPGGDRHFDADYGDKQARETLATDVDTVLGPRAAGRIRLRTVCDLPARALLEAADGAEMLVVGARGLGGFRSLLLGSVTDQCLHHATCPVAVVRADTEAADPAGPVVVGIDGSADSAAALRWAIAEARHRDVPLLVVHAWQPALVGGDTFLPVPAESDAMAEVAEHLAERLLGAEDTTGVTVRTRQVCQGAAAALLDAAADASVLVVGTRGQGGFAGLLLGSVSQHLARHAPCPTVVVPQGR